MPQARHPAASPLPKVSSPRAPAVADFRSPMPRAPVVDSRSRTQPVSAAQPPVRSRTRPRWRSPRVTREPEPAVPEPVVALEALAPAAVVAPVVPERVAAAERPAVQVAAARVPVERVAAARRAAVQVEPELVAVAVQAVPERAVRVPVAVALPVVARPAVAQRAQPERVAPEPVA
ncbi:hypothetical protein C6A86_019395 [Mycobacterium sp. ITM-2016-00316]|uniref:hypothetical protein n=1 Tax=Mycobacterium sp. ITM-2016-00316 TaxID=2099695 RepID=UPI00287FF067|nr:hypothetical protein [Mycobacterium sp. ITM-2016-00316]WNG80385.1 hypothetical protein C6A86_019395 [Mycobacterium sp. ITM-2016-00316]